MTQTVTGVRETARVSTAGRRLRLLRVVILVIGLTIAGRLVWLQVAQADEYETLAQQVQTDVVALPAARGDIVDRTGQILAGNRTSYEVAVEPGVDRETVARLVDLSGASTQEIEARLVICGEPGAAAGTCYRGEPGQPIPVLHDVPIPQALAIKDADLPAVTVRQAAVRDYPSQANAAHVLGYLGDGEGRSGLEAEYDQALRGQPGEAKQVMSREGRSAQEVVAPPEDGQRLVTTLDLDTQVVAEQALRDAVDAARKAGYRATGGSVIVMDVQTGAIRAIASYPTYDPNIWARGLTDDQYAELTDESGGRPLVFRPIQALMPPASTFKSLTTVAADEAGFALDGTYQCPSAVVVGGQTFRNYESRAYGPVSLAQALSVSCDTVFYRLGYTMWKRDGGLTGDGADEHVVRTARDFGLGATTGIDVPGEAAGSVPDRAEVIAEYEQRRDDYCLRAQKGYPEEPNRARARLLKAYARDYCRSGDQYKAGDAMNTAIGQGRTLVTPVQMAVAYAAIANGGTVVTPHLGAELQGRETVSLEAASRGRVSADPDTLAYVRSALTDTTLNGTASGAFAGFPLEEYPVAAKTGTAEVAGKQSTSWFASFAPADDPQYVVIVNVDQGGLGAATSGPVARAIYEQLFGVTP